MSITNEEFRFLSNEYKEIIDKDEEKEITLGLNEPTDYLDEEAFKNLIDSKKLAEDEFKETIKDINNIFKNKY